eukprot:TRINITY_DN4012_c0_g1_i2.p1 TRINITY_DN4012_c0_g1~~TRINITY_DN4012_c0_g1_i2.p1  ORF type:complete len:471 (+),score=118.13 TRINITY_DN4012_c0_g1_i2:152-1414(+)
MSHGCFAAAGASHACYTLLSRAATHKSGPAHLPLPPPLALSSRVFSGLSRHDASSLSSSTTSAPVSAPHQRRARRVGVSVRAMSGSSGPLPVLVELPLITFISNQGRINPPVEPNTQATVFAIFDQNKKLQYVGFSKDVRNSLRTLMARRPELCYFYKLANLEALDQERMLNIRSQWFSEVGLPPPGNADQVQRDQWEKAVDAGSISERGREAAAKSKAKTLQQMMRDRGLKEEMVYDPVLLEQGKCDVLPSQGQSAQELADQAEQDAEAAAASREVAIPAPSGEMVEFNITFISKFRTNGGWMFDLTINKDNKDTRHRVVVGRIYPEAAQMVEEEFVTRTMAFLLHKKVARHTEGLLAIDQFPSNYFSISEVAQKFDDFKEWFTSELPETYWRFNKIHSYGDENSPMLSSAEPAPQLSL